MELLIPLNQRLKERMLSEEEVIKLGKDISSALILYESKGMISRNIKPQNIMVSAFGDYKIGDFRMPEFMDHAPFAGGMGHPGFYQAPEITRMEKYGYTADIYSLGSILYWLLNNRRIPFIGADEPLTLEQMEKAMMKRYRGEKIPAPKNGSEKLKRIVLKACEYRPEDRYASAQELYDALEKLGNDRSIPEPEIPLKRGHWIRVYKRDKNGLMYDEEIYVEDDVDEWLESPEKSQVHKEKETKGLLSKIKKHFLR